MSLPSVWTEEMVSRAAAMWVQGWSAGAIAKQLGQGITRNAVMGRLLRRGLVGNGRREPSSPSVREPDGRPPKAARKYQTAARKPAVLAAPVVSAEPRAFTPVSARHFLTRKRNECSWPIHGEGADLHVCCAPIAPSGPGEPRKLFCQAHAKRGHQKGTGWLAETSVQPSRSVRRVA